ncbi:hypothetical protein [Methylobacterium soli]|uniref:Uncharacterized protein n=1 Tax=Methylobacterium soli TaxID=553447 RepID=A0A6L3ST50_9HYPH|nr:hypothetical protein [Methylobacterium soli]KAB1076761.1 hypothetical protein F6X53_21990 [Methylobacterium soli]GJE42794.1 hypothetical protein AEGHOMDF_1967 [Methylobacterium soli]
MSDIARDPRPASEAADHEERLGFADAIRGQATGYAEKRKTDVARAVSDAAEAIRGSGSDFASYPHVKAFFDNAAEGVEELAGDISRRTFAEIYDEVEAAVRRRPGVTVAAAALAGFALFRLFRASEMRPIPRSRAVVSADVFPTPDV